MYKKQQLQSIKKLEFVFKTCNIGTVFKANLQRIIVYS